MDSWWQPRGKSNDYRKYWKINWWNEGLDWVQEGPGVEGVGEGAEGPGAFGRDGRSLAWQGKGTTLGRL